ncbi:MAG: MFS transporter [Alphaproteobacteria bacterium]
MATTQHPFRAYSASAATYFISMGIGQVVITWLVTVVLHETPERIGIMQTLSMLPTLLLLMVGGTMADRRDPRTILMVCHLIFAAHPMAMAWVIYEGYFSYDVMLAFALFGGLAGAFAMPARDTLLTNVTQGASMQKSVAFVNILQFGGQLVGILMAARAEVIGAEPLLVFQGFLLLLGLYFISRLAPVPRGPVAGGVGTAFSEMAEGAKAVWNEKTVRTLIACNMPAGMFYMGTFMVGLPLLARDVYDGGSAEIAMIQMGFMAGTVAGSMLIMRLSPVARPARLIMLTMLMSATVLTAIAMGLPFYGVVGMIFIWGMGAGISMAMTRSIVQVSATPALRARMLAVFQMTFMGAGPAGAIVMGFLISELGVLNSLFLPPIMSLTIFTIAFFGTNLWTLPMPTAKDDLAKQPSA